jgi:hypothetical protein
MTAPPELTAYPQIDKVSEIIACALRSGKSVEVDGLGRFEPGPDGTPVFMAQKAPQVFIAYVVEDFERASRLFDALEKAGCSPWLDKEKLLPGQNWPRAIERAIEIADAFVPCFSTRSLAKRGGFQSELRYALDCAKRRPLDEAFVFPVRFERCDIPRRISDQVQYVDLFPDWGRGVRRLIRAFRHSAARRPYTKLG